MIFAFSRRLAQVAGEARGCGGDGGKVEAGRDRGDQGCNQQAEGTPQVWAGSISERGEAPKAESRASVRRTAIRWQSTQALATLGQRPGGPLSPTKLFIRLKAISIRQRKR